MIPPFLIRFRFLDSRRKKVPAASNSVQYRIIVLRGNIVARRDADADDALDDSQGSGSPIVDTGMMHKTVISTTVRVSLDSESWRIRSSGMSINFDPDRQQTKTSGLAGGFPQLMENGEREQIKAPEWRHNRKSNTPTVAGSCSVPSLNPMLSGKKYRMQGRPVASSVTCVMRKVWGSLSSLHVSGLLQFFPGQSHVSFRFNVSSLCFGMNRGLLKTDFLFEMLAGAVAAFPFPAKTKGKTRCRAQAFQQNRTAWAQRGGGLHTSHLKSQSHGPTDSSDQPTRG